MYISKSRQVLIIKLSFWTRVRFGILDLGFVLGSVYFFVLGSVYRRYSGGNRSAGVTVLPVEDSVSWHEAIPSKRSLCQENAVLLVVQWLCDTAVCQWFSVRLSPCRL